MTAKQTPFVDILRLHAEDLHSDYGHNKSASLLSQAADEIERLRSNSLALEDEKNDYMDGVGDVLRQDHDGETLWAAAQRVMSECDRLRAELVEARKPDCRTCVHFSEDYEQGHECLLAGGPFPCTNGEFYKRADPVRLYEKEGK
jgi:hypothetical protein